MQEALITQIRNRQHLMRATAQVVLCCFCMVFYSPAVHATFKTINAYFKYQKDYPVFDNFQIALAQTRSLVGRYQQLLYLPEKDQALKTKETAEVAAHLEHIIKQFAALDEDVGRYFDEQESLYKHNNIASKSLLALTQKQQRYSADMAALDAQLKRLHSAEKQGLKHEVQTTAKLLKRLYRPETHHPYDQTMPFGTLDGTVRPAYTHILDLQTLLGTAAPVNPTPADIQTTIDISFSSAIQEKSAMLNNDPVAIYNWVYNNVQFIPSYGSMQGAAYTLETQQGNAMDIASLLIALLRSAGIAARYHYGTVRMPVAEVMNWLGGVNEVQAAGNLLAQGGIPSVLQRINGVDTFFEIEHVWVDIWDGVQWRQVDPSYKKYSYTEGVDLQNEVPFDVSAFANTLESTTVMNEAEGWIQNINQAFIETELNDYREALESYLTHQQPNATVGDIIGSKHIQQTTATALPEQLPYSAVVVEQSITALPDSVRHQFTFELSSAVGNTLFSYTISTPELVGKKIALSFSPATAADEQALINYLPANPQSATDLPNTIPANLFNVIGALSIDGIVVASSPALAFGQELNTRKGLWSPKAGWETTTNPIITGEYQAIGIDMHGLSPQQLADLQSNLQNTQALLTAENYSTLTKHDVVGDLLQSGVMSYFAMTHIQSQLSAQTSDIVYYREPSYGTLSTNARIQYLFNQPQNVEMTGLLMDMDRMKSSAECKNNCWENWRDFNQSTGAMMSAYEHLIPEQLFSSDEEPVEGISAVKALAIAASQGQRIYTINQNNLSTALAALTFDDDAVKQEIQEQVTAGLVVTVHRDTLHYAGWSGVGYTVINPETGAGAYKISGGLNGGFVILAIFGMLIMFASLLPFAIYGGVAMLVAWSIPFLTGASLYVFAISAMTRGWDKDDWIGFLNFIKPAFILVSIFRFMAMTLGWIPVSIISVFSFIAINFRSDSE